MWRSNISPKDRSTWDTYGFALPYCMFIIWLFHFNSETEPIEKKLLQLWDKESKPWCLLIYLPQKRCFQGVAGMLAYWRSYSMLSLKFPLLDVLDCWLSVWVADVRFHVWKSKRAWLSFSIQSSLSCLVSAENQHLNRNNIHQFVYRMVKTVREARCVCCRCFWNIYHT